MFAKKETEEHKEAVKPLKSHSTKWSMIFGKQVPRKKSNVN